jgi:DNA-directed RNA polymerase specialized sigma24 family protein
VRARWEGLHAALVGSVTTLQAASHFRDLRGSELLLARFESGAALLAHFTHREEDLDDKDRLYAALIRAVQSRAPWARLAHTLLWCGLWPGLDRIYRRRVRYFRTDPDELTEAISVAFTMLVGRLDLARVHRVAATLVRNTDREVMDERRRVQDELARRATAHRTAAWSRMLASAPDAGVEPPAGRSFAVELVALREHLVPVIGADADLVLAVAVLEFDQHEAAQRLGIPHDVARKRFQRALLRARAQLTASSPAAASTREENEMRPEPGKPLS